MKIKRTLLTAAAIPMTALITGCAVNSNGLGSASGPLLIQAQGTSLYTSPSARAWSPKFSFTFNELDAPL
jgi:hypothetical protein